MKNAISYMFRQYTKFIDQFPIKLYKSNMFIPTNILKVVQVTNVIRPEAKKV